MKPRKPATTRPGNVVRAPLDVIEVLDRVLDRGIVIDAWVRLSVIGLTLVDIDARIVVASIRTYAREAEAATATPAAPAAKRPKRPTKVMLRCAEGCTFLRASTRSPIRCTSDRSRTCAVSAV